MVSKIMFWTGFGLAVRFWQLGLEMRPFFIPQGLWAYPFFGGIGGSFGYWLQGVSDRQDALLDDRKRTLLEKRRRRAEREAKLSGEPLDEGALGRRRGEGQGGKTGNAGGDGGFLLGRH